MRYTLIRILKHGLPTALVLALVGYLGAEIAGAWVGSQPLPRASSSRPAATAPAELTRELKGRLPFTLAAWGFGLIVAYEVVLHLWRGGKAPSDPLPKDAFPTDAEVEKLLSDLLQQAEAAEAARQRAVETPPPAACQTPAPVDNSPVIEAGRSEPGRSR